MEDLLWIAEGPIQSKLLPIYRGKIALRGLVSGLISHLKKLGQGD